MLTVKRTPRKQFLGLPAGRHSVHGDALYGAFYPPNHLRIVSLAGDPADCTRGLLTFDRDLAGVPGEVDLWVGDRKGFLSQGVNPRVYRIDFDCPLYGTQPWSSTPALGSFGGADGCDGALECAGIFPPGGGVPPAGKIWVLGFSRVDANHLAFAFSTPISVGGGDPGGFWCLDEGGSPVYGTSASQTDSNVACVTFAANLPENGRAGLLPGFNDLAEAADLLCPVTGRY